MKKPFLRGRPASEETTIRTFEKPHTRQTPSEVMREEKRISSLARAYMDSATNVKRGR